MLPSLPCGTGFAAKPKTAEVPSLQIPHPKGKAAAVPAAAKGLTSGVPVQGNTAEAKVERPGEAGEAGKATENSSGPPSSEAELRSSLRPIFDQFDVDSSGSISAEELRAVCTALKVSLSEEELQAVMADADPDCSGAIEYEEFVTALAKQMKAGGQLAAVVTSASSFFGILNPFSWFGGKADAK